MTMTGMGLTPRQAECLTAIRSYIAKHGYSPSYADLQQALGCASKSNVVVILRGLQARGHVQWTPYATRSLRLTTPCPLPDPPPRAGEGAEHSEAGGGALLPPDLQERLTRFCAARGEAEHDVIADAVLLHLDALESDGVEDADALAMFAAAFDGATP